MDDTEELRQLIRRLLVEILHSDATLRAELLGADVVARPLATAEASTPYVTAAPAELHEYLDFGDAAAIRVRGHRIWIEDVLYEHVYRALGADELVQRFPTLTPVQIHAVLLYYYRHQTTLDRHLADWLDHSQRAWAAQQRTPAPVVEKLRRVRAERDASGLPADALSCWPPRLPGLGLLADGGG